MSETIDLKSNRDGNTRRRFLKRGAVATAAIAFPQISPVKSIHAAGERLELKAPTVWNVLTDLPSLHMGQLQEYAQLKTFNHGSYWHGPEGHLGAKADDDRFQMVAPCPLAVAFGVSADRTASGWWGATVDDNLFTALQFLNESAGGEEGIDTFLGELYGLDSMELKNMIEKAYEELEYNTLGPLELYAAKAAAAPHSEVFMATRGTIAMPTVANAPTVSKVLGKMSPQHFERLQAYSEVKPFNHGVHWHRYVPEYGIISDPISVAFGVAADLSESGWWGARVDGNLYSALKFFVESAGGETGIEQFLVEMNGLGTNEMAEMIKAGYSSW